MIIDKNLLKVMIDKKLLKEFEDFCKLNGVDPVKKANEILGWKATTPLDETLNNAWNWQKKLREDGIM